jgi:hypothetical protein
VEGSAVVEDSLLEQIAAAAEGHILETLPSKQGSGVLLGDDPPVEAFLDRYGLSSLQELTTHSPSDNQTAIQPLIWAEDDQHFGRATDPFLGNPPLSLSLRHNSASLIIRVIAPGETLLRDDEKDTILTRGVNGLRVFGDHADAATSKRGPRSGSLVVSHLKQDFRLLRFLLKGRLPRRSIQSHAGRSGLELSKNGWPARSFLLVLFVVWSFSCHCTSTGPPQPS